MESKRKYVDIRPRVILTSIIVISAALALTTLSQNLTKGLMHGVINHNELGLNLLLESLKYGLIPGIITGLIINHYLRPFYIVAKNIFFQQEITEEDRTKAIKVVSNLDMVIIFLNSLTFCVSIIINAFLMEFILAGFIQQLITALSTALIFSVIQANIINLILSEAKSSLKIYSLNERKRSVQMIKKNVIMIVALTIFISSSFMDAGSLIYTTEEKYSELMKKVVDKELTIAQARSEYKSEKSMFLGVSEDEIPFPYDLEQSEKPSITPIYLIYFVQLLVVAAIFQFTNSLFQKRQIQNLSNKIKELSNGNGDLTSQLEIINFDEMGQLTENINIFIFSLRKMVSDIKNLGIKVKNSSDSIKEVLNITESSTQDIVSANEQTASSTKSQILIANQTTENIRSMLKSVDQISDNIETQASFVEQTSSAINEMAANIESVNVTTKSANELSNNLVHVANSGGTAVNQSILAVKHVEEFSDKIISMVKVITDIADKTNLLAMNAAIEAAHAGESGKGFAVVAQEVRKLAEDSSLSAQQISDHIKEMIELVNNGVELSEGAGKALGTVSKDVKQTSQLIEVVSEAMSEQSAGTKEVLGAISSLMDSTNSIKGITKAQQQRNKDMYASIDELKLSFNQIAEATEEQSKGTLNIQNSVEELKKVILDNEETTKELENLLNGFIL